MHDLGDMLVESGFEIPVMDQEVLTITYKSPESLLERTCAAGALTRHERAPTDQADAPCATRFTRRWKRAVATTARIPLTFEVIYGHAWKAVPRMTAEGHGIVRLEDIGRGPKKDR